MSKTLKKIMIFGAIAVVLVIVVFVFIGKTAAPTGAPGSNGLQTSAGNAVSSIVNPQPQGAVEASQIGQEFINQLVNLQAIKLDDGVFSSLSFQSLEDFTIILVQPGNEGRPNPFAPFGSDGTEPDVPDPAAGDLNITPIPAGGQQLPAPNNS